jgi:hypothetical protein
MMTIPKLSQIDFDTVVGLLPADATAARVTSRSPWKIQMPRHQTAPEKLAVAGTERAPFSFPNHPALRITSRPAGLWRVERRVREAGTREVDCWEPISRDTTKEEAMQRMRGMANREL